MKLTCTLENFKKAVYSTERVIGKQLTLPVLENILLETEKGMLKLSATNLEIGVFIRIGAKIEKEGKITVPAKLLSNFVNNLPANGNIELILQEQTLQLKSGNQSAKIKGISAQDFPIIPEMRGNFIFNWSAREIKETIPKLLISASIDNTRPELSGVNIVFKEKEVYLAATDSFRLSEGIIPITIENEEAYKSFVAKNGSIIIPASTFSEVWRAIDGDAELVRIAIEENQIFFQIDGVRVVSRLINGKYPEYRQIMPQSFETNVRINKEELLRATRIASLFTQNKSGEVIFKVFPKEGRLEIEARSEDKGENVAEMKIVGEGKNEEVVFNPRYIIDGISAINSPELALLVNTNSSPVAIRATEERDKKIKTGFTYIIMPIRR
jgi:DNA polymerase-3 subunit beta